MFFPSHFSVYYAWKNIERSYKNNKFEISAPTWNDRFELPDGLYSVLDIPVHFEYIIRKHEKVTDNPPIILIYLNKIENWITFSIKTGYYLELFVPETVKLLGSTKSKKTKVTNGENVPHLEITEVALIHCKIVNNDYQQD